MDIQLEMLDNLNMSERTKLDNAILEFLNSGSKSLLIDGPWGCGKTHAIKEFIKNNKKKKIIYISLFGIESIEEISVNLYKSTHKLKSAFIGMSKLIPVFLKVVPHVKDVVDGLENQLSFDFEKEVKKKTIIVFDDLERLSNNISYFDLLGYINKIFMLDCRIICLISSKALFEMDSGRYHDFNIFKEKVFDSYYLIDQTNDDIFNSIFGKYKIENIDSIYPLFESNIRQAYKLSFFYSSIIQRIDKRVQNGEVELQHNKFTILKASLYSILCCLSSKELEEDKEEIEIETGISLPEEVRKTYLHYRCNKNYSNDFSIPGFRTLVLSLIGAFLYKDYSEFDEIVFKVKSNSPSSILSETYFYLSDDGKEEFKKEFEKELLAHNIHWDNKGISIIRTLSEEGYDFSEEMIDVIAKEIANNDTKQADHLIELRLGIKGRIELTENEKIFIEKLKDKTSNYIINNYIESFESLYNLHKYEELDLFIEKIGICASIEQKAFLKRVIENNFYIPDLSGTINESLWSYCHSMVLFLEKNGMERQFIEYARIICNGSTNKSLVDRYFYLIYYEMNKRITKEMLINPKIVIESLFV